MWKPVWGTDSGGPASATSRTWTFPSTAVVGQVAIVALEVDGAPVVTVPAGWTTVANFSTTGATRAVVAIHQILAGEPGTSTGSFSWTGASFTQGMMYGVEWSGATTPTMALDGTPSTNTGASSVSQVASSITTALANSDIFVVAINPDATTAHSSTAIQERYDISSAALYQYHQPAAGATGAKTITQAPAGDWGAVQFALAAGTPTAAPDNGFTWPPTASGAQIASATAAWGAGAYMTLVGGWEYDIALNGIEFEEPAAPTAATGFEALIEIATGAAGSETVIAQIPWTFRNVTALGYFRQDPANLVGFPEPISIPAGTVVSVRVSDSHTAALTYTGVKAIFREVAAAGGTANLTGTAVGVGAVTGALTAASQLTGAPAGTGTATGALTASSLISGTLAGAGSVTGALTAASQLSGTPAGAGAVTGALTASARLSGTLAGVGAATGALTATALLSGTAAGVGAVTGQLAVPQNLSGTVAGTGTATGALTAASQLAGSLAGTGTTTGALSASARITGTLAGVGSATGALTAPALLSGTAAGTGALAGALTSSPELAGTLAGSGSVTGALTASPRLSGTLAGAGSATGNLTVPGPALLTGTVAGVGSATGGLTASPRLTGSAAGTGSLTGALTVPTAASITGNTVGAGAATGLLTASSRLTGTLAGNANTTGLLTASSLLTGALAGSSTLAGALTVSIVQPPATIRPARDTGHLTGSSTGHVNTGTPGRISGSSPGYFPGGAEDGRIMPAAPGHIT